MSSRECDWCLRPVTWATTVYGRSIPLDPDPNPEGNQAVMRDGTGVLRTRQLKKNQEPADFEERYMPHVATCQVKRKPPVNVIPISRARSRRRGAKPKGRYDRD